MLDALSSLSTGTEGEQEFKEIGRGDPHVAEANKDRACTCEMAWFPASWAKSMLVLAAAVVRSESAAAEAAQKRIMIATRKCRTVASVFMIKVNSTRRSFLSQEKTRHCCQEMFYTGPRVKDPYVLA
jgi:hypothetical protein